MKQKKQHREKILYRTTLGKYYCAKSEDLLNNRLRSKLENGVQLILTSPPFPLNNKKRYGNLQGAQYKEWFIQFAETFSGLLKEDGSIVIELGNSWLPNRPIQSLLHLEALLAFVNHPRAGLRLCQEFICYNPARLPTPAQWVTVNRIRTIDSYTHVWWMAKTDLPKADNRKVLRPYSKSMEALLAKQTYNWGKRPSEHNISKKGFLKNRGGSIMHNLIELQNIMPDEERPRLPENILRIANTKSNDFFLTTCRRKGVTPHPARMPLELATFFIQFLTDPGDLILDPFAGSNTTGFCAERLSRKWISIDANEEYGKQSLIRFEDPSVSGNFLVKRKGDQL